MPRDYNTDTMCCDTDVAPRVYDTDTACCETDVVLRDYNTDTVCCDTDVVPQDYDTTPHTGPAPPTSRCGTTTLTPHAVTRTSRRGAMTPTPTAARSKGSERHREVFYTPVQPLRVFHTRITRQTPHPNPLKPVPLWRVMGLDGYGYGLKKFTPGLPLLFTTQPQAACTAIHGDAHAAASGPELSLPPPPLSNCPSPNYTNNDNGGSRQSTHAALCR
ncbi:hypothetical protein EDB89DRAFT_2083267 [Lactarius sanguifluus]|nr:hypothetical protein EDB89DRAFT_2083267 [Lactarius sanguifluus]